MQIFDLPRQNIKSMGYFSYFLGLGNVHKCSNIKLKSIDVILSSL